MNWLWYLLEANLYLFLFYAFYLAFLQRETFYTANRFYLIGTGILAFVIPVLQLGILKPPSGELIEVLTINYPNELYTAPVKIVEPSPSFGINDYLLAGYLLVTVSLAIKLGIGVFRILSLQRHAKKDRLGKITVVELAEKSAFSFFNLLFAHPQLAEKEVVMAHEMVHIRQKHTVDVLFFELLQIISWFNPVLYFIKKDIKLLHEYIADELSTPLSQQKHEYAMFLIQNSFGVVPSTLTNQIFNQSILKRRINMLNKKRTVGWARLRLLLALPLMGGMLCASTMAFTKEYGYVDLLPEKSENNKPILQSTPENNQDPVTVQDVKRQTKARPQAKGSKKDQIKFPPPVLQSQSFYYPKYRKNRTTGQIEGAETRYVVINGDPITSQKTFYGVRNATRVVYLVPSEAVKKYGQKAKLGAIEASGKKLELLDEPAVLAPPRIERPPVDPPPPRKRKVAARNESAQGIVEVRLTAAPKNEVTELRIDPVETIDKVVEVVEILPTKKQKLDSVKIISIKPKAPKKSDEVQEIRITPIKKGAKSLETSSNQNDSHARYLAARSEKAVKETIQLEIIKAREKAQLKRQGL